MTMLDAPPKGGRETRAQPPLGGGKTGCLKGSVNYPRDKKAIPDETADSCELEVSSKSTPAANDWIEEIGLSRCCGLAIF
jgi:hypothetical protein